jgi:nucleotide-binding universal stress UspA family protein
MATRSPTPPTDETVYREIIVGVDGGAGGRDAACLARVLGPGARRTLVYVQLSKPAGDHPTMLELDRADDGYSLGNALAEERRICADSPACERVLSDSVAAGLDDEAARLAADLIVVGASHRHGLARLLWGDDTRAVLRRSPLALAVAPHGYARALRLPERIGALGGATARAQKALASAHELAAQFGAQLEVRQIDSLATASLRAQVREFTAEVDLLVCDSHQEGALARLVTRSPSDWLIRHVHVPVVIVPT